jgi:hypothetical protein
MALALACALGLAAGAATPEETIRNAHWFEREIGAGVVWKYEHFDDLFSAPQSINLMEVDLSRPGVKPVIRYVATGFKRTSVFAREVPGAAAAINGSFFDTTKGGSVTFLRIDHKTINQTARLMGDDGGVGIDDAGALSILRRPAGSWDSAAGPRDLLTNGPVLVWDGAPIQGGDANRHPRSAVGLTKARRLIMVTVDGRTPPAAGMSHDEIAVVMAALGCERAINLDGGGSATLWGRKEPFHGVLNFPSDNHRYDHEGERPCCNAIAIVAPPTRRTLAWDARNVGRSFPAQLVAGETRRAWLEYRNCGATTWTCAVRLGTARPERRPSAFYTPGNWISPSRAAALRPSPVGPWQAARFSFLLTAPEVTTPTLFQEHWILYRDGATTFGPSGNHVWADITVRPAAERPAAAPGDLGPPRKRGEAPASPTLPRALTNLPRPPATPPAKPQGRAPFPSRVRAAVDEPWKLPGKIRFCLDSVGGSGVFGTCKALALLVFILSWSLSLRELHR